MSTTKASDRLRTMAGSNIAESMGRGPGAAPSAAGFPSGRPPEQDRYVGLNRIKGAFQIPPDRIAPDPNQPRKEFDEEAIDRLAESLKERGQLQPIRVRFDPPSGSWVIIAGERRWRAAVRAGLPTVAAVEASAPTTADDLLEDQLVENCVREDLKPVEQAAAFRALMDRRGWSAVRLAKALNLDDSTIARALAMLGLPCTVQDRVESGDLSPSVAYEVTKALDPAEQTRIAEEAVSKGLTRAEVVEEVRASVARAGKSKGRGAGKAKKVTSRVFRKLAGYTLTVENGRGVEPAGLAEALERALATVRAEIEGVRQDAA